MRAPSLVRITDRLLCTVFQLRHSISATAWAVIPPGGQAQDFELSRSQVVETGAATRHLVLC